jgi:predicted outer membrane protein
MVAKLWRSGVVVAAVLLCATAAVAQERVVNGADQEVVIQLRRLNLEEMTIARLAEAEGTDHKVKALAAQMRKAHEAEDSKLVEYAERKNMNIPVVKAAPVAEASGVLAMVDLTSAARGVEFDWVFARRSVSDHQGMIATIKQARRLTNDPELQKILVNQLRTSWEHLSKAEALQASLPEPPPRVVHLPGEPAGISRTQTGADTPPAAAVIIIGP